MINKISFGGIYLIKFPKSYTKETIKNKYDDLQQHIKDNNYMYMEASLRENIKPQKPNQSTNDILLLTNVDNSRQVYDALSSINTSLADQYFDKTKVYLTLDETV